MTKAKVEKLKQAILDELMPLIKQQDSEPVKVIPLKELRKQIRASLNHVIEKMPTEMRPRSFTVRDLRTAEDGHGVEFTVVSDSVYLASLLAGALHPALPFHPALPKTRKQKR